MHRRGIIYFHMMHNNVSCESIIGSILPTTAVDAIYFTTEKEVVYSREGDPDELGRVLIDFMKSTHEKSIDGFETFLYINHNRECNRKFRTKSINIDKVVRISYKYHLYIDVYKNKVDNVTLESVFSDNKLINIFPDFFKYIKKMF